MDFISELNNKSYTWLITGVAGFVGSNLLETLLMLNQHVIGLDNFYSGHRRNIELALKQVPVEKQANFIFYEGDIRCKEVCENVMKGVDFVLHQAALSSIPKSIESVSTTHEINVNGFFNVISSARDAGVKRFIYASSCAIYGNKNTLPNVETQLLDILSPYNATKYMNELYATTFSTCYNFETIGLRYFNIYGPRQDIHGPYAAVIVRWIHELLQKKTTYIHDDHYRTRDFCYIDDVVNANLLASLTANKAAVNTVYNIAAGEEVNLHHVFNLISNALNMRHVKPISEKAGPGGLVRSQADITKASKLLGYYPRYSINEGIPKLVDIILRNTS